MDGLLPAKKDGQRPDNTESSYFRMSSGKSGVQKDVAVARQGNTFKKAVKSQRSMGKGGPDRQQMAQRGP